MTIQASIGGAILVVSRERFEAALRVTRQALIASPNERMGNHGRRGRRRPIRLCADIARGGLMALRAHRTIERSMVFRERTHRRLGAMAAETIGAFTDGVRHRARLVGPRDRRRRNQLTHGRSVQVNKLPLGGMAGAVGAKATVVNPAWVGDIMTTGAGSVKHKTVTGDPIGILM